MCIRCRPVNTMDHKQLIIEGAIFQRIFIREKINSYYHGKILFLRDYLK